MSKSTIFALTVVIIACVALAVARNAQGEDKQELSENEGIAYLFSYFKGNGEDGLHLAASPDGLNWESLNNDRSFLQPKVGGKLMRDPCIIQGPDDRFHMVWTTSWGDKGIGYASSEDLMHWSDQKYLPVMAHEEKALNCWAPEVFYDSDKEQYLIFWATTIEGKFAETLGKGDEKYNHRMYCVTTRDFEEFSETRLFYEPGFNVIDSTVARSGNRYVMFLKNETRHPPEKNIRVAYADAAEGPYGKPSQPISGADWAEGPTAIRMAEYWYVYFDKYTKHRYGAVRSKDLEHWEDISDTISFPDGTRHGTVLRVGWTVLNKLRAREKMK
jgi:hypothetical protein